MQLLKMLISWGERSQVWIRVISSEKAEHIGIILSVFIYVLFFTLWIGAKKIDSLLTKTLVFFIISGISTAQSF